MALKPKGSLKLPQFKTEQSRLIAQVALAAAVIVFCLLSAKTLLGQALYQQRVISAKQTAVKRLKNDLAAVNALGTQYHAFVSANPNIIGGAATGQGASDGDNAQIVLDALPSRYDFPALTSAVEKIMRDRGLSVSSISGSDSTLGNQTTASPTPTPVTMSLTISAQGNYNSIQSLIADFERSIRPFNINTLQLSGNQNSMQLSASLDSYYQPAKVVNLTPKVVP